MEGDSGKRPPVFGLGDPLRSHRDRYPRGDDMFKIEKGERAFWLTLIALAISFVALAFTLYRAATVL